MSVDDGGLEAIRKSAEEESFGSRAEYRLKTRIVSSVLPLGAATDLGWLASVLGRKILVTYPDNVTEVYTYKEGLVTALVITVIYTDSSKSVLLSAERTV